jgi:hypothetical protein
VRPSLLRTLLAGVAGGTAINAAMFMTFRILGFGWNGGGILLDPTVQSAKLISVWTETEPLPLVVSHPLTISLGLLLFGIGHAIVYRWLAPSWPSGSTAKALRMAGLIFFFSYVFWEFFTPFNQFGEPLTLIVLELSFWAIIALAESFVLAGVFEAKLR